MIFNIAVRGQALLLALGATWMPFLSCSILDANGYDLIRRAERARLESNDEEALKLYQEALLDVSLPSDVTRQLRYRLAALLVNASQPDTALDVLRSPENATTPEETILLTRIYTQLGDYQRALDLLATLPPSPENTLQASQLLVLSHQTGAAAELLAKIKADDTANYPLAQLQLANIAIDREDYAKAEEICAYLRSKPDIDSSIQAQVLYVKGRSQRRQKNYEAAIEYYKDALSNDTEASWQGNALQELVYCLLQQTSPQTDEVEKTLRRLHRRYPSEASALALCQLLVARARTTGDQAALADATHILGENKTLGIKAELLLADASPDYTTCQQALQKIYESQTLGDRELGLWHLHKGLSEYRQAKALTQADQDLLAVPLLRKSVESCLKAFTLLQDADSSARDALRSALLAALDLKDLSVITQLTALLDANKLFIDSAQDPEEMHLLHSQLLTRFPETTVETLSQRFANLANQNSEGRYAGELFYQLGLWEFTQGTAERAEEAFIRVCTNYPKSPSAAEALFWSARTAEKLNRDTKTIRERYKRVYTDHPHSPYAAEAYFACYTSEDYLGDDGVAHEHLRALPNLFPNSPYGINAYYLTGLKHRRRADVSNETRHLAIEAFQKAEDLFDILRTNTLIPTNQLPYYLGLKYRALIERAQMNLEIAEAATATKRKIFAQYAVNTLKALHDDLSLNRSTGEASILPQEAYDWLRQESGYRLAQACLCHDQDADAIAFLQRFMEYFTTHQITHGYYLSRAYGLLADVDIKQGNYLKALEHLTLAEEAGRGKTLSTDERLELCLQKSDCYRRLGNSDMAMRHLSKVINDDSISSLRLKAMLLRAELYTEQGRHELAKRQLLALVRKGGIWAQEAKHKLENKHEYQ